MTTYKDEILAMDRFSIQGGKSVREYDQNGFLHVDYSPLTRVQVAPYRGFEIPGWQELGLDANKIYKGYRSAEELSKPDTIKSMNGIPIQFNHNPDYAHCPAKDTRVGSTGDKARFDGPFLFNSLHITDKKAIDHINDGTMRELSLAYRYNPEMKPGVAPSGEKYDFIMRGINANHLALVEEGRAGSEVLVYDSSLGNDMFEEDEKNGLDNNEPPMDGGDDVEAILKKMVEAGLEPSQVVKFREELQKLKGGDEVVEDEEELVEEEPVEDEPMDTDEEVESVEEESVEEESVEEEPVDEEPLDDVEGEEPVDEEPMDNEPMDDDEVEPVEDEEEVEDLDSDDDGEDDVDPMDDEEDEEDEPADEEEDLDVEVEEGEGAEGAEPEEAPAPAPAQGGAEQVVLDAMKACGLDTQDQNEQRAFAAGVKFGESELGAAKAQAQQPMQQQTQQPQMPQAMNPMMGKKPMGMDTNAIVRKVEARMNAKFRALKECEKTIGKVEPTAYDSAGSVYLDALRQEGVATKGMDGKAARAAYRAYFAGKSKVERKLAQDSKPKGESVLSKTLNRIQFGE